MADFPLAINLISSNDDLVKKLREERRVHLLSVIDFRDFDYEKFICRESNRYVVINIQNANKEAIIFNGLLLRNAGFQVFISTLSDYEDLLILMSDISNHLEKKPDLTTELLVTENATKWLGNVAPIVSRFEREFLKK